MIYDLPWYTIILTFINVIWLQLDTKNPQNGMGKLGLNSPVTPYNEMNWYTLYGMSPQGSQNTL